MRTLTIEAVNADSAHALLRALSALTASIVSVRIAAVPFVLLSTSPAR